jgi:hypothetical protein
MTILVWRIKKEMAATGATLTLVKKCYRLDNGRDEKVPTRLLIIKVETRVRKQVPSLETRNR